MRKAWHHRAAKLPNLVILHWFVYHRSLGSLRVERGLVYAAWLMKLDRPFLESGENAGCNI